MSIKLRINARKILFGFLLTIFAIVIANWISFFLLGSSQTNVFMISQLKEHKIYSQFEANDIDSVYVVIKEEGEVESEHRIDFKKLNASERKVLLDKVREITGAENVIPMIRNEVYKQMDELSILDMGISIKGVFYSEIYTSFIFGSESTLYKSTNIYFFKWYRLNVDLVGLS